MIALGSDHGGFELKEQIRAHLESKGLSYKDFGTKNGESCDYPPIAHRVGLAVASGEFECGILFCGTGIGISIAANKVPGVRAALVSEPFSARLAKEHNNANVLALGGRVVGAQIAAAAVDAWLSAEFAGGRHLERVKEIEEIED